MKVALLGATGLVGSKILDELVRRGHEVTAIVRNVSKVPSAERVTAVTCDALDSDALTNVIRGHDCVAAALSARGQPDVYEGYLRVFHSLTAAVKKAQSPRLVLVGGAGSLQVESGTDFVDTPDFPPPARQGSLALREALKELLAGPGFSWTMLSPSMFVPGSRTGRFRLGKDTLLRDEAGKPSISLEDYAVAFVDELETPRHFDHRFTVGY